LSQRFRDDADDYTDYFAESIEALYRSLKFSLRRASGFVISPDVTISISMLTFCLLLYDAVLILRH